MATDRPRYTVSVDDEMFEQIEDFRFEHRYKTRSQATVELIRLGIENLKQEKPELFEGDTPKMLNLSSDEHQLVDDYRSLNAQGQEFIRQTMYAAKQAYKKMPDVSDLENQA